MSNAERFSAEPPLAPPAKKSGSNVLLILGIGCGVVLLLCCGGFGVVAWMGYSIGKDAMIEDPAKIQAVTAELATLDIPAELSPKIAMRLRVPFTNEPIMTMAVYGDGEKEMLILMGMGAKFSQQGNTDQLRSQMNQSLNKQEDHFEVKDKREIDIEVRGKPAKFTIEKGSIDEQDKIRAQGVFEGNTGPVFLFLQVDANDDAEARVEQIIRSIK